MAAWGWAPVPGAGAGSGYVSSADGYMLYGAFCFEYKFIQNPFVLKNYVSILVKLRFAQLATILYKRFDRRPLQRQMDPRLVISLA